MKTLIFLISLNLYSTSFSQSVISGSIHSAKGEILIGASIMVKGTYDGTVTNIEGKFQFETNQPIPFIVISKYVGYEPQTIQITNKNQLSNLNIELKEAFNELEAVTITAGSFEAGDKKKAVLISSLDMITTPGASGNVTNALQFLPGTSTNGESGKLFVRGGASSESQTFIDGTLVHNPYNSSAPNTSVRSRFNPFMFGGTVFSTGGFSAEYGGALSSVLLLETKGIQEQDQLDLSFLSVGLGIAGTKKWKKSALTLSADYTDLTPYMKIIPQQTEWLKMPQTLELAGSYRYKTANGLLKTYGNYSSSKFELLDFNLNAQSNDELKLSNQNNYLNLSYKGQLKEKWIIQLNAAGTNYKESTDINFNNFNKTINGTHLKFKLKRSFTKKIKLTSGIELLSKDYSQSYQTIADTISSNFTNHTIGGFIESQIYFSKKIVTRIGARINHSIYLNKTTLAPRISTAFMLSKTSQFSLAFGLFNQTPNQDFLIYSNQLNFESTLQYMANYTFTKNRRSIKAEVYYKTYQNLVKFDLNQPFYLPSYYNNDGTGYAKGLDLFFRDKKTIKNGDYWISYSFIDTKRNYLNFPNSVAPRFVSKHNLSVVYKHWVKPWRTLFGASFNYSSPRSYNDPNENTFNNQKMKAYQSLNLNASFLYKQNIIFYASATNVLGYKQEYGYRYSNTTNSEGVYEKSLITPSADRFFILGLFITLSKNGDQNQLDKIN